MEQTIISLLYFPILSQNTQQLKGERVYVVHNYRLQSTAAAGT